MKIRCLAPSACAAVAVCLSFAPAASVQAQRLPSATVPERYTLRLTPDLKAATFSGAETVGVTLPSRPPHHAKRRRDRLPKRHRDRRGQAADRECRSRCGERAGHLHLPRRAARRQGITFHYLHRHPEQRVARLLSLKDRAPQLRRDTVRGHRRAPRLPQLRRAGLQGHF